MTAKILCVVSQFFNKHNNLCNNRNVIIHIVKSVLRLTCQIKLYNTTINKIYKLIIRYTT